MYCFSGSYLIFGGRGWASMISHEKVTGGAEGDRTLDLRIANAALSQLSYRPTEGREWYLIDW